jgi:hypothetical protein
MTISHRDSVTMTTYIDGMLVKNDQVVPPSVERNTYCRLRGAPGCVPHAITYNVLPNDFTGRTRR